MASQVENLVSFNELFSETTDHFLLPFQKLVDPDIHNGMHLTFELIEKDREQKISPILRIAKPEDAKEIVDIYLDIYKGSYPYKEMESVSEVRRMIQSNKYEWLIFMNTEGITVGCFTYQLDFENKRGYMRGFNLKPQYQGKIDAVKACVGSMIGVWSTYHDRIGMWYCENRTAHSKSQYIAQVCGIKPIAFFPCKDVFLNKIESDLMQIVYKKETIREYRAKRIPQILPEVELCFNYSNIRYDLGEVQIKSPRIRLDLRKIIRLKHIIELDIRREQFGYEIFTITFNHLDSYFKCVYTPQVQNFEKIQYNVNSLEELFVFIMELKKIATEMGIRYFECFVSAYNPEHQQLFLDSGFLPRGYIPSWKYNKEINEFEDNIVFNYFKGEIDENISLINEGWDLLKVLSIK